MDRISRDFKNFSHLRLCLSFANQLKHQVTDCLLLHSVLGGPPRSAGLKVLSLDFGNCFISDNILQMRDIAVLVAKLVV